MASVLPCILYFLGCRKSGRVQEQQRNFDPQFKTNGGCCVLYYILSGVWEICRSTGNKTHKIILCFQPPLRNKTKQTPNSLLKWAAKSIGTVAVRRLRLLDICSRLVDFFTTSRPFHDRWTFARRVYLLDISTMGTLFPGIYYIIS